MSRRVSLTRFYQSNKEANRRYSADFYFLLLECWGHWRTRFRGDRRFLAKTQKVEGLARTADFQKLDFLRDHRAEFLDSKKRRIRAKTGRVVRGSDFQIERIGDESVPNTFEETRETTEVSSGSKARFVAICDEVLNMIESRLEVLKYSPQEARGFFEQWSGVWQVRAKQLNEEFHEAFGKSKQVAEGFEF